MSTTLHSLIPAAKLPLVQQALIKAFHTSDVQDMQLLTGGLSASLLFRFSIGSQHYVLRLVMQPDPFNDISNAFNAAQIAADAGIAPAVHYLSVADGILITSLIQQHNLRQAFASPQAMLTALAQLARRLHQAPLFQRQQPLFPAIDALLAQFRSTHPQPDAATEELFAYYSHIKQHYRTLPQDMVSSHNDLNPGNIMYDGSRIWFIDWDAAFQNDRYFDLAILASFFTAHAQEEQFLLQAYLGAVPTAQQQARFFIMQQLSCILYGAVMHNLAASTRPADIPLPLDLPIYPFRELLQHLGSGKVQLATLEGKLHYAQSLFHEALRKLRSPQFSSSMELIKE